MSFITELRRRNVFRVGVAYAVAAWLLVQVADILLDAIGAPPWAMQTLLVFLGIGFFIALFFAWAFELTPEGIKRERDVERSDSITPQTGRKLNNTILVLMALAIAYLLFDKFSGERPEAMAPAPASEGSEPASFSASTQNEPEPIAKPPEQAPQTVSRQSIAVLPFENRSPVTEDEFFIDGIHDDLLTTLARIGGLKVISRTSVSRYEGSDKSIPEIALELGVATIMEGAVQRAGDTVRINVQLIDAQTDEHLWAEIFDRTLSTDNLFAIQSEITERIADALKAELTPDEARRLQEHPTENLDAYSAYLRGMRAFATREVEAMQAALADFQRAVELDPEFALGWASIAQVAQVLPSWGQMTEEEGEAIARPAAERALQLAPDLGEAHLAMAMVLEDEEALPQFKKAIELLPNHAQAHAWYANTLQGPPGPEWLEALDLLRKAESLDPLSPHFRAQVARHLIFMGRFEEAERKLRVLLQSDPDFAPGYGFMAWASVDNGRFDEAAIWSQRYLQKDPQVRFPRYGLVDTLASLKDKDRLARLANTWRSSDPDDLAAQVADVQIAMLEGRYEAAEELAGSPIILDGPEPERLFNLAYAQTARRDYGSALSTWRKALPGFFDEGQRTLAIREHIDLGCLVADIGRRAGQSGWPDALAKASFEFVSNELPRYMEHAALRGNLVYCHAFFGDFEAALAGLETRLRERALQYWWDVQILELFDPLRGDPRFENLMLSFEEEISRQRASLDRLEAEAGLEAGS